MDFLKKLQKQPDNVKKIILWLAVIFIGIVLAFFWIKGISKKMKELESREFIKDIDISFPKIEIPEIKIPDLSEEELKQLEEELNQLEE